MPGVAQRERHRHKGRTRFCPRPRPCPTTWSMLTRDQLVNAVVADLEALYDPRRRHFALGCLGPADCETAWHRQQRTPVA